MTSSAARKAAPVAYWPSSRPRAPSSWTTTSQTVTGIVTSTLLTVKARNAFARSSSRNSVSRNSYIVNTQRPKIAIRISSGSERSSSSSEIGSASGIAIAKPIVVVQKSEANPVFTTRSGSSSRS